MGEIEKESAERDAGWKGRVGMWFFKACPRCLGGDLVRQADEDGPFISCFQCSHRPSPGEELRLTMGVASVRQVAMMREAA